MKELTLFAARVNAVCERMNEGLATVAVVLAIAVVITSAFKGSQFAQYSLAQGGTEISAPDFALRAF